MPFIRFICPHCEKPAEVQATAVTRSRPCPHCAETVVLQVASKVPGRGLVKRRAVLVDPPAEPGAKALTVKAGPSEPPPASPAPLPVMVGPAYDPVGLEGDVIERLKLDPEVVETRRRLTRGVVLVAVCIVTALVLDRISPWSLREKFPAQEAPAAASPKAPVTKNDNNVIGLIRSEKSPAPGAVELPASIVFEGAAQPVPEVAGEPDKPSPNPIRIVLPADQTPR